MSHQQQLRFAEETQAAFAFLEESYGFSRTTTSARKVRYESDKVFIEVNHGDYDFEVSIAFGRLRQPEPEQFDFTLFLRLVNPSLEKSFGERIADTPDKLRAAVQQLAAALLSEGMDIIKGSDVVYNRMRSVSWWQFRPNALKGGEWE